MGNVLPANLERKCFLFFSPLFYRVFKSQSAKAIHIHASVEHKLLLCFLLLFLRLNLTEKKEVAGFYLGLAFVKATTICELENKF